MDIKRWMKAPHYCDEWDGLYIHPRDIEATCCRCSFSVKNWFRCWGKYFQARIGVLILVRVIWRHVQHKDVDFILRPKRQGNDFVIRVGRPPKWVIVVCDKLHIH